MGEGIHVEKLSSSKTEILFLTFTIVFLASFMWQWLTTRWSAWTIVFLCFFAFFLFYTLNYRTLKVHLTTETLQLNFGLFTWRIATTNIETCYVDKTSLWRVGGAGIHFTWIKGKYRAFFNFLEYPRVVVTLKKKKGAVREIAFSTKQPERVLSIVQSSLN